jgi:hypothetical protein
MGGVLAVLFSRNGAAQYFRRIPETICVDVGAEGDASFLLWGEPGHACFWGLWFLREL